MTTLNCGHHPLNAGDLAGLWRPGCDRACVKALDGAYMCDKNTTVSINSVLAAPSRETRHSLTNDVLSVGVQLTAGDQTTSSRRRQGWGVVWSDWTERRGLSEWQFEMWMVDQFSAAGLLVTQSHRARQIHRRNTQRHFHPETLCVQHTRYGQFTPTTQMLYYELRRKCEP